MDEEATEPTEDDLIGKNGAYAQSIAILHNGLNSMSRELSKIKLNAGNWAVINGEFPSYVISAPNKSGSRPEEDEVEPEPDWAFKPKFISESEFYLVPGPVAVNGVSTDLVATVGGISVYTEPPPTLPIITSGGCLYFKYTYDIEITYTGSDPSLALTSVSAEVVQYDLNSIASTYPAPARQVAAPTDGSVVTVTTVNNVVYNLFAVYSSDRRIVWASNRYFENRGTGFAHNGGGPWVDYGP